MWSAGITAAVIAGCALVGCDDGAHSPGTVTEITDPEHGDTDLVGIGFRDGQADCQADRYLYSYDDRQVQFQDADADWETYYIPAYSRGWVRAGCEEPPPRPAE